MFKNMFKNIFDKKPTNSHEQKKENDELEMLKNIFKKFPSQLSSAAQKESMFPEANAKILSIKISLDGLSNEQRGEFENMFLPLLKKWNMVATVSYDTPYIEMFSKRDSLREQKLQLENIFTLIKTLDEQEKVKSDKEEISGRKSGLNR